MTNGEYDQLNKFLGVVAYIYLIGWIIMFILGIIVQAKINKETEKNIDDKKIENSNFYFKMDK